MTMGKNRYLEHEERVFGEVPHKRVCRNCFGDEGLRGFITSYGTQGRCSYCGARTQSGYTVSLENVINHIQDSLRTEYPTPEDSGTPYENNDGGWLFEPYDISDMLDKEPLYQRSCELYCDISSALSDNSYLQYFFEEERYDIHESWDSFTNIVKHKSRFLFCENTNHTNNEKPSIILKYISKILRSSNAIKIISDNNYFYRVRLSKENGLVYGVKDLGTVPKEYSKYDNRMSPAGISMFYGAKGLSTAILETDPREKTYYYSGKFTPSRDIKLINFSEKIKIPSIYDEKNRNKRFKIMFINDFIKEISKPVLKDGNHNIEYIPTQLITEYLRYNFLHKGTNVDGIMYKSSVNNADVSYALFVDNEHCINKDEQFDDKELYLMLQLSESGTIESVIKK